MEDIEYLPYKIGTLCSHSTLTGNSNFVELICKDTENVVHKVSQMGKICSKCASLITKSASQSGRCLCCSNLLEKYLKDHWICPHSERSHHQIDIKCLGNQEIMHEVPFKSAVCQKCCNKIRAAFMYAKQCLICNQKENEVFENVEKTMTLPSYYYFQYIIQKIREDKLDQQIAKEQIQLYCLAGQKKQVKCLYGDKINFLNQNSEEHHQSKRYDLYPRCQNHKNFPLNVCNTCLVSILNINSCPYGCPYQKKTNKKKNKADIKVSQTGFLSLYPKLSHGYEYIELFLFNHFEEIGRLDRWEVHLRKVKLAASQKQKAVDKFTLYGSAVQISKNQYLFTGGANNQFNTVSSAFKISISEDLKEFDFENIPNMKQPRSGHANTYLDGQVFIIGGFQKQNRKVLSSCEKFNVKTNKWELISPMKIQRSKPTVFAHSGYVYVLGGLSLNQELVNNMCERYDPQKNCWETVDYDGYDLPFVSGSAVLNSVWGFPQSSNIITVGGSNYSQMTDFIQTMQIENNTFNLNKQQIPKTINCPRVNTTLSVMPVSKSDEYIAVIFGGNSDHQPLMKVDAFRLKIRKQGQRKVIQTLFSYDQIMIGSYKLLLRQNIESAYQYMMNKLQQQRLMEKQKYDDQKRTIKSDFNTHMIQKMWYGIGKCFVGLGL